VRVLKLIDADTHTIESVEMEKQRVLKAMAHDASAGQPSASASSQDAPKTGGAFKVGDIVALRADPSKLLPIIEVIPAGSEYRYHVFENGAKSLCYESQLLSVTSEVETETPLSAEELTSGKAGVTSNVINAYLTLPWRQQHTDSYQFRARRYPRHSGELDAGIRL
jgi:hypothetical protein